MESVWSVWRHGLPQSLPAWKGSFSAIQNQALGRRLMQENRGESVYLVLPNLAGQFTPGQARA